MGKLTNTILPTVTEPMIKWKETNREAWRKIQELAKKITRLNKKKVSAIRILLRERRTRY